MTNQIKKINKEFIVVEKDDKLLWTLNKKDEKILIYDKDIVENIFEIRIDKKYRDILYLLMNDTGEDDGTDEIIRNKIEELKNLIIDQYYKYIPKDKINKYIKRLTVLETKIRPRERGKGR